MISFLIWYIGMYFTYGFVVNKKPTIKQQATLLFKVAFLWPFLLGLALNKNN